MAQVIAPGGDQLERVSRHWKKPSGKALTRLRLHVPRILIHEPLGQVDVLQLKRSKRTVARTGQDAERYQGSVAFLDGCFGWHGGQDVLHLIQRWHRL